MACVQPQHGRSLGRSLECAALGVWGSNFLPDQKFSPVPLAPIRLGHPLAPSAPLKPQHHRRGGGGGGGGHWAPRTRKRHQQEHRPQWPTESSDPTQHAKGRTGDCPGPRKETTTRRNVTQGGWTPPPPFVKGVLPPPLLRSGRRWDTTNGATAPTSSATQAFSTLPNAPFIGTPRISRGLWCLGSRGGMTKGGSHGRPADTCTAAAHGPAGHRPQRIRTHRHRTPNAPNQDFGVPIPGRDQPPTTSAPSHT